MGGEPGPDPLRVVVLADTHLRTQALAAPGPRRLLLDAVWSRLAGADAILHAGDVLEAGVLDILGQEAPVYAVLGNNDRTLVGLLPHTRTIDLGGVRIGMIHDSGPRAGRARRMRRRFPDAQVVVFGHSHAPVDEPGEDGQLLFNPGSPTQRRAERFHTLGELRIAAGAIQEHRIVVLDGPDQTRD
jgi:putative phosphoesterase